MEALAIITIVLLAAFLYWINREQADYERAHYDPQKERKP
jgi:hypothetical protein